MHIFLCVVHCMCFPLELSEHVSRIRRKYNKKNVESFITHTAAQKNTMRTCCCCCCFSRLVDFAHNADSMA